jgi:hypothetical protein
MQQRCSSEWPRGDQRENRLQHLDDEGINVFHCGRRIRLRKEIEIVKNLWRNTSNDTAQGIQ